MSAAKAVTIFSAAMWVALSVYRRDSTAVDLLMIVNATMLFAAIAGALVWWRETREKNNRFHRR